jgi:mycothiol synthase
LAPDGRIVAYALLYSNDLGKFFGEITVHPDVRRRGLGTHLRELIEARANERSGEVAPDARITLNGGIYHGDEASQRFVERAGMTHIRSFLRMEIDLTEPPPAPKWPAGLEPHTFVAGQERAVYEADDEAFQDHWGHAQRPYDEWLKWSVQRADFDPTLWFLAMDGAEIAGAALCWFTPDLGENGMGWVGQLWVRRPWRKRGLGLALLHHAFAEFYRRGVGRVALGVDSQNLTGATRLYERAGMTARHQWDSYQKELRPGVEYTTTALDGEQA